MSSYEQKAQRYASLFPRRDKDGILRTHETLPGRT